MNKKSNKRRSQFLTLENLEDRNLLAGDAAVIELPVYISEFLAANVDGLATRTRAVAADAFSGESEAHDWIEIHNSVNSTVDLTGYFLTDDRSNLQKWQFPNGTKIRSNQFMVVFASEFDIRNTNLDENGNLHTNFKLSLEGDYLGLVSPDGVVINDFGTTYPKQFPDVSYGVTTDGDIGYFKFAAPGRQDLNAFSGAVANTTVDVDRGFYDNPISVAISTATPGAAIRYTTDGSLPTPSNGKVYNQPIRIDATTTLRSAAFKNNFVPSDVITRTYIFVDQVGKQTNEFVPNGDYVFWTTEMDPDIVNSPKYRNVIDDALLSLPTLSITGEWDDLFGIAGIHRGQNLTDEGSEQQAGDPADPAWVEEQDVSIELIYPEGFSNDNRTNFQGFHINAGLRIQGGGSRWFNGERQEKQSFGLRFREEYGSSHLDYPVFESAPNFGRTAVGSFDKLILRAGTNKSWGSMVGSREPTTVYTRDQLGRDLQTAMSGVGNHGTFVHLYLNGIYWGLYNTTERADADFMSSYFGGDDDDWFAAKGKGGIISGDPTRYNEFLARVARTKDFTELQEYLAVDEYIDLTLINVYADVGDFPQFYYGNRNDVPGPVYLFNWDQEDAFGGGSRRTSNGPNIDHLSIMIGFNGMWTNNAEFRMRFADRVYLATKSGGVLSDDAITEMWDGLNDHIYDAVVAESARWGDSFQDKPRERDIDWEAARKAVRDDFVGRADRLVSALRATDFRELGYKLYPSIDPSELNRAAGNVNVGTRVQITNPNNSGKIYYTTDGSDPRKDGGGVSNSAQVYNSAIVVNDSTHLKTRVLKGNEWSALNEAIYTVALDSSIIPSEIMYHPADPTTAEIAAGFEDSDEFEFIELRNNGTKPINLLGHQFTFGVEYVFPAFELDAGEYGVVVKNQDAFSLRYGNNVNVIGQFDGGGLSNSGERLTLVNPTNEVVFDFSYEDSGQWPAAADGSGASLQLINDSNANANRLVNADQWTHSVEGGGSPGKSGGAAPGVVINEVVTNTSELVGVSDSIEIFNPTNQTFDIGGWYLSDSSNTLLKYKFPAGTKIRPNQFHVVQESDFNVGENGFAISGTKGDDLWLVAADGERVTTFVDNAEFPAADVGEALGRTSNSLGRFVPLQRPTLGATNSSARIGPLVISEINYNPGEPSAAAKAIHPGLSSNDLEYVEIHNPTNSPVDLTNWRLRGIVDYDFPEGTTIEANGYIGIVSFQYANPTMIAAFREHYGIDDTDRVLLGPFAGDLVNSGGRIVLQRPGTPPADDLELIPRLVEDEVFYDNASPWPATANGGGKSLQRNAPFRLGYPASEWTAANPSLQTIRTNVNGDVDLNGVLDVRDIDHLCGAVRNGNSHERYDLNSDGKVDNSDYSFLIENIMKTTAGDTNLDRIFNSEDLLLTFQAGGYEDDVAGNATWSTGDWNCDKEFGSGDLIAAFRTGSFQRSAQSTNDVASALEQPLIDVDGEEPSSTIRSGQLEAQQPERVLELNDQVIETMFVDRFDESSLDPSEDDRLVLDELP